VLAGDGQVLAEDRNRENTMGDATRHPEFELARWAAANMTAVDRAGATVFTSGEHCPMCAAAHAWVGLGRIVYVSSSEQLTAWLAELGVPPRERGARMDEYLDVLRALWTEEQVTFHGRFVRLDEAAFFPKPVQRPHPPLWYGTTIPENADWPAANDVNIVTIALRPTVRLITDRYRAVRARLGKAPTGGPLLGVARHVVVADTDEAALAVARRAYPHWRDSFRWLFARHGAEPRIAGLYPPTFDELAAIDNGIAGSPRTVRDFVAAEVKASASNYLLSWFAFGDMTVAESLRSIELFAREVMPAFANVHADAAE